MVIVMNMATGVAGNSLDERYGDEVLNAGWADVPRIAWQALEAAEPVAGSRLPPPLDVDAFMRRLYASQE